MADSAAYGARIPAESIREALLLLGLREVRRLVVVLSLSNSTQRGGGLIDHAEFWPHSLGVAEAAEVVAALLRAAR